MHMYHVCDLGKISESAREKSERDIQNGDDIDSTDKRSFSSPRKALEIYSGACTVADRHVKCLIYRSQYAFFV